MAIERSDPMPVEIEIRDGDPWWLSPDIWVVPCEDPEGPSGAPIAGATNYVWAMVHNRGGSGVVNATVRFYWAGPSAITPIPITRWRSAPRRPGPEALRPRSFRSRRRVVLTFSPCPRPRRPTIASGGCVALLRRRCLPRPRRVVARHRLRRICTPWGKPHDR